jgi:hypothetical protein
VLLVQSSRVAVVGGDDRIAGDGSSCQSTDLGASRVLSWVHGDGERLSE